jgi:hypothetical protein
VSDFVPERSKSVQLASLEEMPSARSLSSF